MSFFKTLANYFTLEPLPEWEPYALVEAESTRMSMEEALVKAICMDMEVYPSHWDRFLQESIYKTIFYNKEIDVKVIEDRLLTIPSYYIGDMEISKENYEKITTAFQNRFGAEILEKLLKRLDEVQKLKAPEVLQAARPKLVDPFEKEPMDKIREHLNALKTAAEKGRALPPPPRKLISANVNTSLQLVGQMPKVNKKLSQAEFNKVLKLNAMKRNSNAK